MFSTLLRKLEISTAFYCKFQLINSSPSDNNQSYSSMYRHVQVNNQSAIDFYKKFGFEIVETKEQYYKRIEPADAHVLMKVLRTPKNDSEKQN